MAKNKEIVEILGIPSRTLQDWRNAEDYRATLFYALKSMSVEELKSLTDKTPKKQINSSD